MADTTYSAEYGTLAKMFSDNWKTTPAGGGTATAYSDVQYENKPYTPTVGTKWVRFTIQNGGAIQASIGAPNSNLHVYAGVIQIQCFAPLGMGALTAKDLADKAIGIFQGQIKSGYVFKAGHAVDVPNSFAEGWYQVNAIIPFQRECFK